MRDWDWIDWTLLVGLVILPLAMFVGIFVSLSHASDEYNKKEERKQAWFDEHKCVRIAYIGSKYIHRLYKCDDGNEYIWEDIPLQQEK